MEWRVLKVPLGDASVDVEERSSAEPKAKRQKCWRGMMKHQLGDGGLKFKFWDDLMRRRFGTII